MIISEFINKFEELFPKHLAYKWDNVGLQVGSETSEIKNILLSLDLTDEVVDEAISNDVNLIVVHHPMIFTPLKTINSDTYLGSMIKKIIKNDINVYVAHTNFDLSNYGMNKILADMLNLKNQKIIELETLEEGLGRFGDLNKPMSLVNFISEVKRVFNIDSMDLITRENDEHMIKSVAICGGSGSSLLTNDTLEYVDVYITGDVTYHHALDACNNGITVLNVGHNIEKHGFLKIKKTLEEYSSDYRIYISQVDTNPYKKV